MHSKLADALSRGDPTGLRRRKIELDKEAKIYLETAELEGQH